MNAIRIHKTGEPEVMQLEAVDPPEPGPGQVVVKVAAAGVNPVDTYLRAGIHGYAPTPPYTPGIDGAGEIISIGKDGRYFSKGDRVYIYGSTTGTYAEQCLCTEAQVHHLPTKVTFQQGASIGVPYAAAYRALYQRGNAKPGDIVMVHGASGGVGIAAVQWAHAAGMTVVATAGTERGRNLARDQGAHFVLDHHSLDYVKEAHEITGRRGFDIILEMLANENLNNDLKLLAHGGRVVIIGSRGRVQINPRYTMSRESSIVGMSMMTATEREILSIHSAIIAGLEYGNLRPVVGVELPLDEAAKAHHILIENPAYGKIVLIP